MSPLIRPTVVRWWCGFGLVENTCANIALLEFMFHGIKTCRLPNTTNVYDLAMRTESSSSLINSELGNMNGGKKKSTQHPHNGSAKVKMMAARFLGGLGWRFPELANVNVERLDF